MTAFDQDLKLIRFLALMTLIVFTTTISVIFIFEDYREYSKIYNQCEKIGYIQDKNTRILCSVEDFQK